MNEKLHRVIGIDLGTTYSAVATYNTYTEQAEIIRNRAENDQTVTPSVIGLDPVQRKAIVGFAAKRSLASNQEPRPVIEIKREMGEEFSEDTLEKFGARGVYNVGDPVRAYFAGQWLLPQEISAFTLMKMKEIAEKEIGEEIHDAVVTVPAYFTEKQKKATKEAVLLAGLYPRQLIAEPTAAAICYGLDRVESEKKIYLVFDLGGGTFDVSIIEVKGEMINVIATSGDPRLGGGDFDDAIAHWAMGELMTQYGIDVRGIPGGFARIKYHAEHVKIKLSTFNEAPLDLMDLDPQRAPKLNLTRQTFEELIDQKLAKSLSYVDEAINLAGKRGVLREHVDAILLVGGSSIIPRAKQLLLDYFKKDESFVRADADPAAVVARGAAIMAYRFAPSPPPFDISKPVDNTLVNPDVDDDLIVHLITEHSLGVEVQNQLFSKIIEGGSSIPIEITKQGYTNAGTGSDTEVRIYQGDGTYVWENTLIGTMHLGPYEPQPPETHQFEVSFSLDKNGLLTSIVNHVNAGRKYQALFEHKTGVGGADALAALRHKLLGLYAHSAAVIPPPAPPQYAQPTSWPAAPPYPGSMPQPGQGGYPGPMPPPPHGHPPGPYPSGTTPQGYTVGSPTAPVPPPHGYQAPTPGPAYPAGPNSTSGAYVPPRADSAPPSPQGYAGAPATPGAPPPQGHSGGASSAPVPPQSQGHPGGPVSADASPPPPPPSPTSPPAPPAGGVVPATANPPEQFKSIYRRAQKLLLSKNDGRLLQALNDFTLALSSGASDDDLTDLGDQLADVYDDVRSGR